ncbi:DNA sulfur modification protein DndD [Arhodomonas sp. AD133]|uniref:DNA sulfur modification protein DndD n=1 Tax=Arhodomonas sp. AD133 TaxID=3415009 RepID=UPI003EC0FD5A
MIIKEIRVTDFRSFAGTHSIDVAPRDGGLGQSPIILFGGLNGAGKTTLLTAVRLALYGKQSLGLGTSVREYHKFLAASIHRNANQVIQRDAASVGLRFTYARHGRIEEFTVTRSWSSTGNSIREQLQIERDGQPLTELTPEQAQGFLNELIPIGVADLFFFDGEKIAELAEDDTGEVLEHAVKKLLGLDIVERLHNDLGIYLRREKAQRLPDDIRAEVRADEQRMEEALAEKDRAVSEYERLNTELQQVNQAIDATERRMAERGGAWAESREAEKEEQARLIAQRDHLKKELLREMGGAYPLSFATESIKALLADMERASEQRTQRRLADTLSSRLDDAYGRLAQQLDRAPNETAQNVLQETFSDLLSQPERPPAHLDVSDTQLATYKSWFENDIPKSADRVKDLRKELADTEEALEQSSLRIERSPDSDTLAGYLKELKQLNTRAGELRNALKEQLQRIKGHLRECQALNRRIQANQESLRNAEGQTRALDHAESVRNLTTDLTQDIAARKLRQLEVNFLASYRRLARKEDVAVNVRIDPKTFDITLFDEGDNPISKADISAGEKQIYAVAILEALATTSGRQLPLIVDTPLGRLDSAHRHNLVSQYFPNASHQVLILSTDTEIDADLHHDLGDALSHTYQLAYDPQAHTSYAEPGYFWHTPRHLTIGNDAAKQTQLI